MLNEDDLKKKIINEMTVDYSNMLEKNFELAKDHIKITSEGTIDVLHKENLKGTDKILLYLVGRRYAKEGGLCESEFVTNKELEDELGIKTGSLLPWLKVLRDTKMTEGKKGKQSIKVNLIESVLKRLSKNKNEP